MIRSVKSELAYESSKNRAYLQNEPRRMWLMARGAASTLRMACFSRLIFSLRPKTTSGGFPGRDA